MSQWNLEDSINFTLAQLNSTATSTSNSTSASNSNFGGGILEDIHYSTEVDNAHHPFFTYTSGGGILSINNTPRSGAMLKTYFLHTNPAEEFLKKINNTCQSPKC